MENPTKKCPMCAEEIPFAARVCEYCGTRFDVSVKDGLAESRFTEEPIKQPVLATIPLPPAAKQSTPWGWIAGGLGLLLILALVGGGIMLAQNGLPFLSTPTNTPRPTFTSRPISAPTSTPEIKEFTVVVPANALWFDTGIHVDKGQSLVFTASGFVCTWTDCTPGDVPGPNGSEDTCQFLDNSNCLLNDEPYGALIGKIGNGEPFLIGSSLGLKASQDGTLQLAVNDNLIYYEDNSGSYFVTIKLDNHIGCESGEWSRSYSDSFETDQKWWWTGFWDDDWVTSTNAIENGKYRIAAVAKQPDIVFYDDIGFKAMDISDIYVTVEAQHISGPGSAEMGFMFRWVDWENHYWAGLNNDGKFYLGMTRDGELITLVDTEVSTYQPGKVNRFTLGAAGNHITASINGQEVADVYDGTFKNGEFNVYIWLEQDGDSGIFEFDNFEMCLP